MGDMMTIDIKEIISFTIFYYSILYECVKIIFFGFFTQDTIKWSSYITYWINTEINFWVGT